MFIKIFVLINFINLFDIFFIELLKSTVEKDRVLFKCKLLNILFILYTHKLLNILFNKERKLNIIAGIIKVNSPLFFKSKKHAANCATPKVNTESGKVSLIVS
jgi:hypothetical protein